MSAMPWSNRMPRPHGELRRVNSASMSRRRPTARGNQGVPRADLHKLITDKQVRKIIHGLIEDGWTFVRMSSSNHPILSWDDEQGRTNRMTMPLTPGDRRAMRNALADARRISGIDHGRTGRARPQGATASGQSGFSRGDKADPSGVPDTPGAHRGDSRAVAQKD